MSRREIRAFDYVNQPYEPVRKVITEQAPAIFQRATKLAQDRSGDLVAALSINLAGVEVSKDITIELGNVREDTHGNSELARMTSIELRWQAKESPGLFPAMDGELRVYPLSFTETQVELVGSYDPPMGVLGSAVDAVVGHRVAEASIHRFVRAIVERLRQELAAEQT
ncbi:MAG TPA: hypothetical protein VFU02_06380 [Polyangiaceae bacterium]|nr:hypothetical protein [Polyangiaceae bacterium]